MKKTLFLALVAVLLVSATAFGQYQHGWVTIGTKTQTALNIMPYGTTTAWTTKPFLFPTQASSKGFIALEVINVKSGGTAVTKPQVVCRLIGPDGTTAFTDSSGNPFAITAVDTVNRPTGTTIRYAVRYDFSSYGNVYGFLLGFKGYVAAESSKVNVLGVRY